MNEASTDLWVWELIKEAGIDKSMSPQGSAVKELEERLHQQELEKLELKHQLELEKNKSIWQKIFKRG